MALTHKKGDSVRQVVPVIEGKVVEVKIVDDDVQYCVEYVDAAGETHQRFFAESDIEAVPAA
jgi:hypothetical protein